LLRRFGPRTVNAGRDGRGKDDAAAPGCAGGSGIGGPGNPGGSHSRGPGTIWHEASMSRSYVVHMPIAEARHLAGVGQAHPVGGLAASRASKSGANSKPGRPRNPANGQSVRGPFAPDRHGIVPPGRVEYLGEGTVRLDEAAIGRLAGLSADADFRVIFADSGPVLLVGAARYPAIEPSLTGSEMPAR